jgi:lysophospholipase
MDLVGIESNPVPNGVVSGSIVTSDGVNLRFARWRPTSRRVQGTICLFHGRTEQIEKYFEVIGDLRRRGFVVATLDWRGQGGSDRRLRNPRKGHIDSFTEYDRDLDAFMQHIVLPDCPPPHYALAHSTGGLICLRAARTNRARFARMVLTAPLAGLGAIGRSQQRTCRFAAIATALGFGELYMPKTKRSVIEEIPFEGNELTSDPLRFARNVEIAKNAPEIAIGAPTIGWVYAACRAIKEAADPDFGPSIRIPVLVVAAALDRVVSLRAIETLVAELRAGAQVVIAGARHELMMERDTFREQFWAAFDTFIPGSRAGDGIAQTAI